MVAFHRSRLGAAGFGSTFAYVVIRIVAGALLALYLGNPTNRIGEDIDEKN
jgi:hypothetical protein